MGRARATGNDLPRYMHIKRGIYYFVRPRTHEWVRLGDDRNKAEASMQTMLGQMNIAATRQAPSERLRVQEIPAETYDERRMYIAFIDAMYTSARSGAKSRKLPFEITKQDILTLMLKSQGKCSLSGIPFSDEKHGKRGRMPWWPSLDRKDSKLGYTPNNIRIVCHAVNVALWDFGDDVLIQIAKGILRDCLISSVSEAEPAATKQDLPNEE